MKLTDEQYKRADWLSVNERKEQFAIDKVILEQKVEEMQKTLEWYADDSRYEQTDGFLFPKILYDRGERARQALKGETE